MRTFQLRNAAGARPIHATAGLYTTRDRRLLNGEAPLVSPFQDSLCRAVENPGMWLPLSGRVFTIQART